MTIAIRMAFFIVFGFFGAKVAKIVQMAFFFLSLPKKYRNMLIVNIKELVGIEEQGRLLKRGKEMSETGRIKDAFLLTKGKKIVDYGPMNSDACRQYLSENHRVYDVKGCVVMPAFCDSHTHIVYANSRETDLSTRYAVSAMRKSPKGEEVSSIRQRLQRQPRKKNSMIWRCNVLKR